MRTSSGYLLAAAVAVTASSGPLAAQDEQQQTLQEVVVTAEKREEKLKDVPIAIVAVSGDTLQQNAVRDLGDLSSAVPDVHIAQSFAQGYLSIRGLASGINPGFESTVGQVIDGYFYPRDRFAYLSFLDVARVEVLKGPQGALIGKNTTAGAINITTAQPTATPAGSVQIEREFTGDPGWNATAAVSGPLVDTLEGRIAIRTENHSGYMDRLYPGGPDKEPTRDDKYGRASLLWTPTDDLTVTLRGARAEMHDHGRNIELVSCDKPFIATLQARGLSQYEDCKLNWKTGENYSRPALGPGQYDLQTNVANIYNLTVNWNTALGTISSLTGYADFDFLGQESGLRTALATRAVDLGEQWRQISEELRLVSHRGALFDYIIGGYFLTSHQDTLDAIDLFGPSLSAYVYAHVKSNTYSGFGNLVWHVTDTFDATLEGRYTEEDKDAHLLENNTALFQPAQIVANDYDISPSRSEGAFSPGVKLSWRPDPGLLVYANYNRGFKGGGFNDFLATTGNPSALSQSQFGPEKTDAYELGTKWSFDDARALLTVAVFRMETRDLQVTALVPTGQIASFAVENAARTRSQGIETELSWRPVSSFVATARGAYLDAKYQSFPTSQCFRGENAAEGCVAGTQNLTGSTLPFSPRFSGSLDAEYDWNLFASWRLVFYGQGIFSGWYWNEFANDPTAVQRSFQKYNARISLESDHWQYSIIGRNLSDARTFVGGAAVAVSTGATTQGVIDPPREVLAQVAFRF